MYVYVYIHTFCANSKFANSLYVDTLSSTHPPPPLILHSPEEKSFFAQWYRACRCGGVRATMGGVRYPSTLFCFVCVAPVASDRGRPEMALARRAAQRCVHVCPPAHTRVWVHLLTGETVR